MLIDLNNNDSSLKLNFVEHMLSIILIVKSSDLLELSKRNFILIDIGAYVKTSSLESMK